MEPNPIKKCLSLYSPQKNIREETYKVLYTNIFIMLSIYNPAAPVANRIYYLKHYETYDGVAINQKMFQILTEYKEKALLQIIDAILAAQRTSGTVFVGV